MSYEINIFLMLQRPNEQFCCKTIQFNILLFHHKGGGWAMTQFCLLMRTPPYVNTLHQLTLTGS